MVLCQEDYEYLTPLAEEYFSNSIYLPLLSESDIGRRTLVELFLLEGTDDKPDYFQGDFIKTAFGHIATVLPTDSKKGVAIVFDLSKKQVEWIAKHYENPLLKKELQRSVKTFLETAKEDKDITPDMLKQFMQQVRNTEYDLIPLKDNPAIEVNRSILVKLWKIFVLPFRFAYLKARVENEDAGTIKKIVIAFKNSIVDEGRTGPITIMTFIVLAILCLFSKKIRKGVVWILNFIYRKILRLPIRLIVRGYNWILSKLFGVGVSSHKENIYAKASK